MAIQPNDHETASKVKFQRCPFYELNELYQHTLEPIPHIVEYLNPSQIIIIHRVSGIYDLRILDQ
ncbi:hypothetical protein DERF_008210 [Dermatophagoides farinae]|uniref:Uncharacterized protein n=1 Tax=Dermatophagoides farinae TaxID=6954 RepID=A0A922L592_DERFA|nr:hypothetical protein DERF_008210 [Dermatophagoides farinae]